MNNVLEASTVKECLELICDIGYDYDGCNSVESLKELIDELVDLASHGLKFMEDL